MIGHILNEDQERKIIFLLEFTHELIMNSDVKNIFHLKKILESRIVGEGVLLGKKEIKEIVKEKIQEEKKEAKDIFLRSKLSREIPEIIPRQKPRFNIQPSSILRIPEPQLPPEFQYLSPIAQQREIDLGKINPFIKDPRVKSIECGGANKRVVVSGSMGMKPANVILSQDDIADIIEKFSQASKIPSNPGVYRVVVGSLILSAIISDVVGTRFMIKKIRPAPNSNSVPPQRLF